MALSDLARKTAANTRPQPKAAVGNAQQLRPVAAARSLPPPPAINASYGEFIDWASQGGLPFPGDEELAIRAWLGFYEQKPGA